MILGLNCLLADASEAGAYKLRIVESLAQERRKSGSPKTNQG